MFLYTSDQLGTDDRDFDKATLESLNKCSDQGKNLELIEIHVDVAKNNLLFVFADSVRQCSDAVDAFKYLAMSCHGIDADAGLFHKFSTCVPTRTYNGYDLGRKE